MRSPSNLVERLVVEVSLDPFLSLRALAAYSGLSVRKLRSLLGDPRRPLPYYRVGGKLLVRRSEFDGWISAFKGDGGPDLDHVVSEILRDL